MSASAAREPSYTLATLFGIRRGALHWGRLGVLLAALFISYLVWPIRAFLEGPGLLRLRLWLMGVVGVVVLAGAVLAAFLWLRNEVAAAALAALASTLVMLPVRWWLLNWPDDQWRSFLGTQLYVLPSNFLFLTGLALALRWLRPIWLALGLGGLAGVLASTVVFPFLYAAFLGGWSFTGDLRVLQFDAPFNQLEPAVFAAAFWGGLQLPWARLAPGELEAVSAGPTAPGYGRISKPFFLGSTAAAFGIALPLVIAGNLLARSNPGTALPMLGFSLLPMLFGAVVMMVLVYKMWAAIQDGQARTTPGKALGFLFIPFFNLYWAFQALWGWAKDYNSYLDRHRLSAPKLPTGLFLAYTILCFTGPVPVLGLVLVSFNYFVGVAIVAKICDAINALPPRSLAPAR